MKCNRFLGHKWSRWHNKLGAPRKDGNGILVRVGLLVRRCFSCGYIEEEWKNSCRVFKETSDEKED